MRARRLLTALPSNISGAHAPALRAYAFAAVTFAAAAALAGCSAGTAGPQRPADSCTTSAECETGFDCQDGRCMVRHDAASTPADPGVADGGPGSACRTDDECPGGACLNGACCGAGAVCGDQCCRSEEACFANACVRPGNRCRTSAQCGEAQICELALGSEGTDVCMGTEVEMGRCIDLPPRCEGGDDGECIRACEHRPEVQNLDVALQWRWRAQEHPSFSDVWSTPVVGRLTDANCDDVIDELDPPNVVFVSGNSAPTQCAAKCMDPSKCTCDVPADCDPTEGCTCNPPAPGEERLRPGPGSACRHGVLRMLDGRTGEEVWSLRRPSDDSSGFLGSSLALGDVNDDGRLEIVAVSGEGLLVVVDGSGTLLARSEQPVQVHHADGFGWGGAVSLADMDQDGVVEASYGRSVFSIEDDGIVHRFDANGGHGRHISFFVDLGEDEDLELLAGRTAYRSDGEPLWNRVGQLPVGFSGVGDFDGDGRPEVVHVGGGQVWILEGATGEVELGPIDLAGDDHETSGGPPTVADFDGDGKPEIGIAQRRFYFVVKPDYESGQIRTVWDSPNHDMSSSVTGSTVFDFEGDGIAEVVYNDECFLWVYDGPTGAIRFATPTTSFTANEASLVADVDGDGHAEILMGSNGADPTRWNCRAEEWLEPGPDGIRPGWEPPPGEDSYRGISVFRDAANSWVRTRALWNQHAYHVSNVCSEGDDACGTGEGHGAIPRRQRANWQIPWLNNFRQNVQEEGIFRAPDATVTLAVDCAGEASLVAAVRNRGEALLPGGVRVAFYRSTAEGQELVGTGETATALFPGQAVEVRVPLPDDGLEGTFVARIDDREEQSFRECDTGNNTSEQVVARCII